MRNSRLAQLGLVALLPLIGFIPSKVNAEANLVEEYVYVEEEGPVLAPDVAVAESLYKEWQVGRERAKRARRGQNTASRNYCSCVLYAKSVTGYTGVVGNARNWPITSQTPSVGAVIVTYESWAGHVGIVAGFDDQYVYLESEANYSRCQLTRGRAIPINSRVIKGYWHV